MRSFSKAFGLAGIRLGYLIGSKKNIEYVSKTRTGYESNSISTEIASFFIDNHKVIKLYQKNVKEGLKYLKEKFNNLKIENTGGLNSNFIFINLKNEIKKKRITNFLKKNNIYVRSSWPKPYHKGILISGAPINILKKFYKIFFKAYKLY